MIRGHRLSESSNTMNFAGRSGTQYHKQNRSVSLGLSDREAQEFSLEKLLEHRGTNLPINIYAVPPDDQLDLSEAEDMVNERVRMLRVFDTKAVWNHEDWNANNPTSIKALLNAVTGKDGTSFYKEARYDTKKGMQARKRDLISHFLVRLYCCQNEELEKWFLHHECKFLQFQLMDADNKKYIKDLLIQNNLPFELASDFDMKDFSEDPFFPKVVKVNGVRTHPIIYKLPFSNGLDVVRKRRCILLNGQVFVEEKEMLTLIIEAFRKELKRAIASIRKRLPLMDEDDRLLPLLTGIHHDLVTKADLAKVMDGKISSRKITPEMVDQLAQDSFPPCMRNIHENLRKNHHLKHYGRLYYSLFLKSLGMSLEDCLEFFKQEFIKTIPLDKFQKEYTYNIRYNYGQEGKRVNLSSYGCSKIINSNPPGPGDAHGCPFRHFDKNNLVLLLRRYGLEDEEDIRQVMDQVEAKNYTASCSKFFCGKHPGYFLKSEAGIYHPNQFYVESRRALRGLTSSRVKKNEDGDDIFDDDVDDAALASMDFDVNANENNATEQGEQS